MKWPGELPIKKVRFPIFLLIVFVFWTIGRAQAIVSQNVLEDGRGSLQSYLNGPVHSLPLLMKAYVKLYDVSCAQPSWGEAQHDLGLVYMELSAWRGKSAALKEQWVRKAQESFRKAIQLEPIHAVYHSNLAGCLEALGEREEAEVEYRRTTALEPRDPEGHYRLACFLLREGRPDEAIKAFRNTFELAIHPQIYFQRMVAENQLYLSESQLAELKGSYRDR